MLIEILRSNSLYIDFALNSVEGNGSFFFSLFLFLGLIMSISIHEFAHAIVAKWMGDETAYLEGRVTINPFQHFDLVGFLMICFFPFGYGKPVPVNVLNFQDRRKGVVFTSVAGPISNIIVGVLLILISSILYLFLGTNLTEVGLMTTLLASLLSLGQLNFFLAFFNMIPIPPLDGSNIFRSLSFSYESFVGRYLYYPNNFILLALVIFSGVLSFVFSFFSGFYSNLFTFCIALFSAII